MQEIIHWLWSVKLQNFWSQDVNFLSISIKSDFIMLSNMDVQIPLKSLAHTSLRGVCGPSDVYLEAFNFKWKTFVSSDIEQQQMCMFFWKGKGLPDRYWLMLHVCVWAWEAVRTSSDPSPALEFGCTWVTVWCCYSAVPITNPPPGANRGTRKELRI